VASTPTPEAPPESPDDIVNIQHPDFPSAPGRVSREAFETNYADKGFVLVDDNGDPIATKKSTATKSTATGGNPA
jgi:hypothetical protein